MAEWVEEGTKAPDFTLPADDGTKVKLSTLRGQPVVLYFYPKDDTPGCTKEACSFRDRKADLTKLGAKVFGVSADSLESHGEFRDKFKLNFPLLADVDHKVAERYGGVAREEHVRQEIAWHSAIHVPHRSRRQDCQGLEERQGRWSRPAGARCVGGARMTDDAVQIVRLTPEGRGAVAVLLVEGPTAAERVDRCCSWHGATRLQSRPLNRILHGHWGSPDGEDVIVCQISPAQVEIHCHGGRAAIERIAADLTDSQTQTASWKDWVAQHEPIAIRAEARSLLAAVRTERTAAILLDQYSGALEAALAGIFAAIDAGRLDAAKAELRSSLDRAPIGLHLVDPWRVVLTGPPNVGKSSLINALIGYHRSIVFDQPGTTRDVVTAVTALDGWLVELSDTAGLRESFDPLELRRRRTCAAGNRRCRLYCDCRRCQRPA